MYNVIEYSVIFLNCLLQYHRDETTFNNAPTTANFGPFKFGNKLTESIAAGEATKHVALAVPLKRFSIFCRILELHLINCEINIKATWLEKYFI